MQELKYTEELLKFLSRQFRQKFISSYIVIECWLKLGLKNHRISHFRQSYKVIYILKLLLSPVFQPILI